MVTARTHTRYDGIQALRFVAALLVVVMHSTHYAAERLVKDTPFFSPGAAGVDIFFVISGFVMIISSQPLWSRADGWKQFGLRRIARIVPLYWALLTLKVATLLLAPAVLRVTDITPWAVISSYLFLPSFNHDGEIAPILFVGWTLNFEMFFYLLLVIALKFRVDAFKLVGGVFAVLCLMALLRAPGWPAAAFYFDTIVLEFGFGMLIARAVLAGWTLSRPVAIGLLLAGFAALLPAWDTVPVLMRPIVWGIPAAMIVAATACLNDPIGRRLPTWLLLLGNASYALYLVHPLIAPLSPSLLAKLGWPNAWLSVALSVLSSIILALFVYRFAERPMTELLRRQFEPETAGRRQL